MGSQWRQESVCFMIHLFMCCDPLCKAEARIWGPQLQEPHGFRHTARWSHIKTQVKQVSHWSKILRFKKFKVLDFKKQNHETQVDGTERCRAKSRLAGRQVVHQEGSWGGVCFMLIWKQEIGRKPIKGSIQTGGSVGGSVKSRPTGQRRGLNFQSASMLIQFPSFLPTAGEELRLPLGTWGLGLIWALPSSCTDPIPHPLSKTQDLGRGWESLSLLF